MKHSRRAAALTALAVAGATALTACGSDDDANDTATQPTGGPFPVTVEHAYGETTVESAPQRIVTAGFNDLDFVLALGETPVATRAFSGYDYQQRPWAEGYATDIPEVGEMELDYEAIAAAEPDLISATYSLTEQAGYDTLAALAPTIGDLTDGQGGSASWEAQLETIGEALGKEQEAQELRESVDADFETARSENPQFEGRTAAVAMYMDGSFYILGEGDPRGLFFYDLGFTAPDETGEVSAERIDLLDQDTLVILGATQEQLAADPLFAGLDVVSEDRTVYLGEFGNDVQGALGFASPLSLPYLIDATVPALAAASDDDPSTAVPTVG
ncbi:iron-siderophore ABC transporter substrate-binding protein [Rhodococcus rhodnii]|uniref:Iron ABC transporter periplasmic-binding protein n=2 Tax=Rhodococcus rhodnii TaxID=38312 RepID=R7WK65_9NOCA|nr:iron-siderophore ABC transporter substrate-binding protein [Rhodococcus rhodnii]EOM75711.1 iron ABC transporter periplasmic-binding protein [Rhodococcus rhodnii LMG 5362]TXG89648.1 iron-siderophore ABC transporter substrate-binding protein [Rhodococcus rhodnii]